MKGIHAGTAEIPVNGTRACINSLSLGRSPFITLAW